MWPIEPITLLERSIPWYDMIRHDTMRPIEPITLLVKCYVTMSLQRDPPVRCAAVSLLSQSIYRVSLSLVCCRAAQASFPLQAAEVRSTQSFASCWSLFYSTWYCCSVVSGSTVVRVRCRAVQQHYGMYEMLRTMLRNDCLASWSFRCGAVLWASNTTAGMYEMLRTITQRYQAGTQLNLTRILI